MASVLVVEDESDVRDLIIIHLERMGHTVVGYPNAEDALAKWEQESRFDLAIIDWMLPGMSGIELTEKITGTVPVLMITARAAQDDVVTGLEKGADDYITKPFEIPIFQARVAALLRRASLVRDKFGNQQFRYKNLVVDGDAHEVRINDVVTHLTPSEFKILLALLQNRGKALSRKQLIDLVQGEDINVIDRTIDTHVFGLRKKLGAYADLVETIRGIGYRISIEE